MNDLTKRLRQIYRLGGSISCVEAADEIERLTKDAEQYHMAANELRQQLAEAKKDAERYRWLCQVATESQWVEFGGYTDYAIISKAIDQAMREG